MKIKEIKAQNGAKIVAIPVLGAKSVAINFGFRTGSRNETRDISGMSHFIEHMTFKGSEKRKTAKEISRAIDAIGAEFNASTGKEFTIYYIKTTKEYFDLALDIVGNMVTKPLFEQKEIDKEKGTIIQEANMYADNPALDILFQMENILFGDIPMGWEIHGFIDSIKKINAEKMCQYYKKYYNSMNTTLTIVGDIPSDYERRLLPHVERFKKDKKTEWDQVKYSDKKIKIINKKTDQTHIGLVFPTCDLFDERRYVLKVIATILGGYMSSRIFTEIREKRGWAYRIWAYSDEFTDSGQLGIFGGVRTDRIEESLKVIKDEILNLGNTVTDEEIERAKGYIKGSTGLKYEDPEKLATYVSLTEILKGKADLPEKKLRKIGGVTKKDIIEVSKELFKKENLYLALIGPFKNKEKFAKILKS